VFVIIAGRQVITADRLEVLVLGAADALANGAVLEQVIDDAAMQQALAVLPWGLGKWVGRRGARVAALLSGPRDRRFFVGDNGGRPRCSPTPRLLRQAVSRGIWNLPGSDPLPLPNEARRAGSHGFVVPGPVDFDRPFAQIREFLDHTSAQPSIFGERAALLNFARSQAALRWRKRPGADPDHLF
jgi:hypothetical protein